MAKIFITDLSLRTIIGTNDWERKNKQDIMINIIFEYDSQKAACSDNIQDTIDYKALKNEIIHFVENSNYQLIEKLAEEILNVIFADDRVLSATVRLDKPHALRFAKSVAIEVFRQKSA